MVSSVHLFRLFLAKLFPNAINPRHYVRHKMMELAVTHAMDVGVRDAIIIRIGI